MPGGDARHEGRAGEARHVLQFVRHAGVGNEGAASGDTSGHVGGDKTPQVAGMRTGRVEGIVQHAVVDLVHASGHGFEEAAAPDDGVERHGDAFLLQLA